jgi:uncharacterized integral membrane protein
MQMTTHPTHLIGRLGETLRRRRSGSLRGLGLWWTFAAALVVGVAIIIAIAQNSDTVRVHYIVWDSRVSLIVVVLTTALVAILLDQAGGLIWRRRRRARIARHNELEQLRDEQRPTGDTPAASEL